MGLRKKRKELMGLIGAIGVVIGLAGFVGGYMTPRATIVWMFGVWIVGATLVNLLTDSSDRS